MRGWWRWSAILASGFMLVASAIAGYTLYASYRPYTPPDEAVLPHLAQAFPYTRFLDRHGAVVDLRGEIGKHRVLLIFMRGFDGYVCWYCTRQTADLVTHLKAIEQTGTQLYLVYPGPASAVPKFLRAVNHKLKTPKEMDLPVPVLLDVDLKATTALGIPGDLTQPSSFVIDQEGRLVYRYVGKNMQDRPTAEALLKVLAGLPAIPPTSTATP